jgi:Ca-activated chloride channel homolog
LIRELKKPALFLTLVSLLLAQDHPVFKVKVDMVVLSFQVTDNKGHYINGLKPKDLRILEDGIQQKFVTFAEGSKPPVEITPD